MPALVLVVALLGGCGGGGGSDGNLAGPAAGSPACSVSAQQSWLANYMDEWYFWRTLAPRPAPGGFADVPAFFRALLYTGGNPSFPADRWSSSEPTESFNRFYGEGQTLGYGLAVAGLEVAGQAGQPLWVRQVEPLSPAGTAGLVRGDEILALNGRLAADLVLANDFALLTPSAAGQTLTLRVRGSNGAVRDLALTAAVYALSPVPRQDVVTSAQGRRWGYLQVNNMIEPALAPLNTLFAGWRAQGLEGVVLDLRYNGGGLVSTGAALAAYLAPPSAAGQTYASLRYNELRSASNNTVRFPAQPQALAAPRVVVLTGRRTCSASEQLINGLRGIGVDVVTVGEASCGKPVGSLPTGFCGTTYSVVNFESVNARGEGRYWDGLPATCAVAEDFRQALGNPTEPLLAAGLAYADQGRCPAPAAADADAAADPRRFVLQPRGSRLPAGGDRPADRLPY
jgi:hypothetical protein